MNIQELKQTLAGILAENKECLNEGLQIQFDDGEHIFQLVVQMVPNNIIPFPKPKEKKK